MTLPLANESLFVYVGAVMAAWAVLLAFLGLSRHSFPPKGGERIVIAISVLLMAGSVGTAIGTAKSGPKAHGGVAAVPAANGTNAAGHASSGSSSAASSSSASSSSASSSSSAASGSSKPTKLSLSADPSGQLRFNTSTLAAKTGNVQIVLSNPSPLSHNISIQGPGANAQGPTVGHGGTSTVTANLTPGTYTFYCSVPGHRQAGMQGTLTVK